MNLIKLRHLNRLIGQLIYKPDIAIVGGYHGGNLGDMALGHSVKLICDKNKLSSSLQTIYNIDSLPWQKPTKATVIGGGAVAYKDSLKRVRKKLKGNYSNLAFLGVDFNEKSYSKEDVEMFKKAFWISCRSQEQASFLKKLTNREDIYFHPDLVFSYNPNLCEKYRKKEKKKKLLINAVPLYGSFDGNKFFPNLNYQDERPELFSNYENMINGYISNIQELAKNYLKMGYEVETISFTEDDYKVVQWILKDLKVTHNTYSDNISMMIENMGDAEILYATRYHATILGIKLGLKLIPMAYAKKNENLFLDFGFHFDDFNSSQDFALNKIKKVFPLVFDNLKINEWEQLAQLHIEKCISISE